MLHSDTCLGGGAIRPKFGAECHNIMSAISCKAQGNKLQQALGLQAAMWGVDLVLLPSLAQLLPVPAKRLAMTVNIRVAC